MPFIHELNDVKKAIYLITSVVPPTGRPSFTSKEEDILKEVSQLIRIGMLHHRKHPDSVIKSYAYAAVAKAEGTQMVYFSPGGVDFIRKTISGFEYKDGKWVEGTFPFPDVIYNTGSPEKLAKSNDVIQKLKKTIPFTTHSIGNKMAVYKRLKEAGEFTQYLIPSEVVRGTNHFFSFLEAYRKIVFKPVNGRKGISIIYIERVGNDFRVLLNTDDHLYSYDELKVFVSDHIQEEEFLVQPYINCRTKDGSVFDFRLHVQKDGDGKWVITSIYPRIGAPGTIVSNINNGGSMNYLVPFLKQEFGDHDYFNIKRYLENFSLLLARHLDELQKERYSESIDELGIDVALDDLGKIWIYEVNWRPGCPPTFYLEMDVVKNTIQYCIYLAKEKSK
jgi:YheC/D like ATP-grasp